MSLPSSPRSCRLPSLPTSPNYRSNVGRKNTSSTNSSRTLHAISQIFLASSPTTMSPPPLPPKHNHHFRSSLSSDFHIALPDFDTSCAQIGLSPPTSPPLSGKPIMAESLQGHGAVHVKDGAKKKDYKALPPSPVTPSRAPAKAAKILGVEYVVIRKRSKTNMSKTQKTRKVPKHFRPLPSQTIVELERFLGHLPPKPSKKTVGLKRPSRSHDTEKSEQVQRGDVRHKGQDGTLWMDVEEEQEFAWLMSTSPTSPHIPGSVDTLVKSDTRQKMVALSTSPKTSPSSSRKDSKAKVSKRTLKKEDSFMDFDDVSASFVPRRIPHTKRSDSLLEAEPWGGELIDILNVTPSISATTFSSTISEHSELVVPPQRLASNPMKQDTNSNNMTRPPLDRTDSTDSDASASSNGSSGSKKRTKSRPPPLTLRPTRKNPYLPIISDTPATSTQSHPVRPPRPYQHIRNKVSNPYPGAMAETPFVRPRQAPIPGQSIAMPTIALPTLPTLPKAHTQAAGPPTIAIPTLPTVRKPSLAPRPRPPSIFSRQNLPSVPLPRPARPSLPSVSTGEFTMPRISGEIPLLSSTNVPNEGQAYRDGSYPLSANEDMEHEDISVFEPVTPVSARPAHKRVLSGGSAGEAASAAAQRSISGVKNGGAWLKKVVVGKRQQAVRV